ncbi:MAG TPA: heme biosynthesis protein HemY [Gammaproteobacteria bacterium]|nr:heme biosynthesis protein HemY [Gammaproteobacteria bacterium]
MSWLWRALAALTIAVLIGLWAYQDNGYVLLGRGHTTVEMSLTLFILLLLFTFIAFYVLLRMLLGSLQLPEQLRGWRRSRRARRAARAARRGMLEMAQGNWSRAERALVRHAEHSDMPLLNYLAAARAAQKQDAPERRDQYLAQAHQAARGDSFAVELTQAELQIAQGQNEQALATLVHLHSRRADHPHVLYLLTGIYISLQSWGDIKSLLPALRKHRVYTRDALARLEKTVELHLLRIAAATARSEALVGAWEHVSRPLRQDVDLLSCYTAWLIELGEHERAEKVLREALRRQWHDRLVALYGRLHTAQPQKTLATAEGWLRGRENNATLLLALGRLARHCELWGKARAYLEASLGVAPAAETCRELGELLEQMEETELAAKYFREGLLLQQEPDAATCCEQVLQSLANSKASE